MKAMFDDSYCFGAKRLWNVPEDGQVASMKPNKVDKDRR